MHGYYVNVYDLEAKDHYGRVHTYYAPDCDELYVHASPPTTETTLDTTNGYYIPLSQRETQVSNGWTLTTDLDSDNEDLPLISSTLKQISELDENTQQQPWSTDGENALMLAEEPASCRPCTPTGIFSRGSGEVSDNSDVNDLLLRDGADGDLASKKTV